ncbi:hypothetical protein [Rhodanobacter sp. DHB23]|uniref:hypothetical protein n=1 Tax=Rhodanobacter sp. DHB23 TaxID=2775923 RepID=UPI00177C6481|nr:hypothetical protein [Rhodanobacter sp. DHB23]MBD8873494.1 hypothetical protein [Rhodanobacter sp. DHB23]
MGRHALAHLYPWDVIGDPDAVPRVRDLGVDAVALAAAYHSVRAATPLHPAHRIVDAPHAAMYVPFDEASWRGRLLQPATATWLAAHDPFSTAAQALRRAGLKVHAWIVLTHASRLAAQHPQFAVRNAFGDSYRHALCPAHDAVLEYCARMAHEIVRIGKPDGVVLEAAGPMGFVHGGHHEKTDGADFGTVQKQLLSLCFCTACTARYAQVGIDAGSLRALVQAGIDRPARSIEAVLGEPLATRLAQVRGSLALELRRRVTGALRRLAPELEIILHASADPWATGAFASVAGGVDARADVLVANCWAGPETALAEIAGLARWQESRRLAAYVLALPPRPCDARALRAELDAYAGAGVDEFHFYHAGLASRARLAAIRTALRGDAC